MTPLSLIFGAVVGLSLGLTGGGGAIFAVPLLVYGLGVDPREAIVISLAVVGTTSFVGFLHRWKLGNSSKITWVPGWQAKRRPQHLSDRNAEVILESSLGEVEFRTGLLFAVAGMLGAPVGTWIAAQMPEAVLLLLFAGLMVIVAFRLWQQASQLVVDHQSCSTADAQDGPTCQRDARGVLILNSRCAVLLLVVGILTGVLSGVFGVGGGFVIVPALVLFSGMSIHRAVGTSLLVISLVSVSGIAAQIWTGQAIPLELTGLFILGGIAGLFLGQQIGRRLTGPVLQKVFAIAILAVAAFVIIRNLTS